MFSQQIEPAKLNFSPGFYNYGTLYLTILRISTDVASGYGAGPKDNSQHEKNQAMGRYILVGRWLSALAGAGIGWVTFLILYRRTHLLGSVAAGVAVSFAPGLVVHSRFQTVDVLATLFVSLSLLYATKLIPVLEEDISDSTAMKLAGVAGLFAGLSAGTKYTGILALIAVYVVVLLVRRSSAPKLIGISTAVALLTFVVTTPGIILDNAKFMQDFAYEMTHTSTGHGLVFAGTPSGFTYHIANLQIAFGLLLVPFAAVGLGRGLYRKHAFIIALCAFAAVYYILIGRAEVKFLRYVFPLIPIFAVGFGWLIGQAHIHPNRHMRIICVLGFFCFAGFIGSNFGLGGGLTGSAVMTMQMARPDVRDVMGEVLRKEGAGKSVGVVSDPWFYTSTIYPEVPLPRAVPFDIREQIRLRQTDPSVLRYIPAEGPDARLNWDVRLLTELQPEFVTMSSFEFDDLDRLDKLKVVDEEFAGELARFREFRTVLHRDYEMFKGDGTDGPRIHDLMYIRPRVAIWKRKTQPSSIAAPSGSSTPSEPSGEPATTP